jgi:hypothetical protein
MIWDVKICLAKIKDGKGNDLKFPAKKSLLTTIRPKPHEPAIFGKAHFSYIVLRIYGF